MRSINNETRLTMNKRRNFVNYATMTLSDGTVLNLKPSDFRMSGNLFTDDWVDGDAFQLGTAIGKTATILLDNTDRRVENTFELQTSEPVDWSTNYGDYYTYNDGFYYPIREEEAPTWEEGTYYTLTNSVTYPYGKFSEYDFYMAYFQLFVCLPDAYHYNGELRDEMIPIGIFTVTTPTSHGSTIEITGVDNMYKFDRSFDECNLDFTGGQTLISILNACCNDCGVAIGYTTFDNQNLTVSTKPEDATYRQVVSWIAQIAGCNATISNTGALTLKSYNMSVFANDLDGGSFTWDTTEKKYRDTLTWTTSTWWTGYRITFNPVQYGDLDDVITEPGIYKLNLKITDIADPSNFNAEYRIQESTDNGATFTTKQTGALVNGDNRIDYLFNISREDNIIYKVQCGQDNTDPNASQFKATYYVAMYSDGDTADGGYFDSGSPYYTSGDSYDGGDFSTPLGYHNLTSVNGTSVITDDIKFTGVSIINDDNSIHYPDVVGWDYYAMEVADNPFVAGHESTIAESLYNKLEALKFRPFTTQSIQDPTIEAGDCCLVYDVKGNMYNSIITNVVFRTGGMTDLSCNAEPPVKQGSRYVSSAAYAVAKAEKRMDNYNEQVAHFNEIANAALGYYKTYKPDPDTGALITYLHDHAELDNSRNVVMITGTGIFISDDYDTARTWNSGFDTTTATMLMNLIYVHGLTADWIRTGELDVGGLDNKNGIIRVYNSTLIETETIGETASEVFKWLPIGPSQITKSGTYRCYYTISNVEAGKDEAIQCQIQKRDKWDGTNYSFRVVVDTYNITEHYGEFPIQFEVDITDGDKYYMISFSRVATTNASYDVSLYYNVLNTLINNAGVDTSMLFADGGEIGGMEIDSSGIGTLGTAQHLNATRIDNDGTFAFSHSYRSSWVKFESFDSNNNTLRLWTAGSTQGGGGLDISGGAPGESSAAWTRWGWNDGQRSDGYYVSWYQGSDKRLKENIISIPAGKVRRFFELLNPVRFNFKQKSKADSTINHYGIIAQEVEKLLKEIDEPNTFFVEDKDVLRKDEEGKDYTERYKYAHYEEFHGWELAGIKDLYEIVQKQQKEIDDLKKRLDKLEGK